MLKPMTAETFLCEECKRPRAVLIRLREGNANHGKDVPNGKSPVLVFTFQRDDDVLGLHLILPCECDYRRQPDLGPGTYNVPQMTTVHP